MANPFSLKGKTILVTGSASGIGRTTAIECSKLGARILLTDMNEMGLIETLSLLKGKNIVHKFFLSNFSDFSSISALASFVKEEGGINGFVNNAGIGVTLPILFFNEKDIDRLYGINAKAPALLTQQLLKKKAFIKGASIVFTVSIAGCTNFNPGNGIYSMSKSALNAFVKTAAVELAHKNIRCNAVNPGTIDTPMMRKKTIVSDEDRMKDIDLYPLKCYGRMKDVAYGIIYLLSDASSWITGINLIIDGGRSIN